MAFAGVAVFLAQAPGAFAQRISVQQPSIETFSVGTTVSAPDRGRVSVGGVGRSRSSRSTFGPFRSGTNMGLSSQSTSLGVGVRIHDLAELDRQARHAAERSRSARDDVALSPSAERAYATLRDRSAARDVANGTGSVIVAKEPQAHAEGHADDTAGPSAKRLLDRARQAESAGKRGLALAYLRTARDAGSVEAGKEIDRLSKKKWNQRQNPASR
jgi:hypothetical protein